MGEGNWAVAPTLTSMPVGESTMAEAAIETASLSAPRATCCGLRSTRSESMPMDDGALGINAYLGAALGLLTGSRGLFEINEPAAERRATAASSGRSVVMIIGVIVVRLGFS